MYYATQNQLTGSKLKDYLKSPNYFYRKHILQEIQDEYSPSFLIGSAVDCWITEGKDIFTKKYKEVGRRNLKNKPEDYIELNATQYAEAVGLCEAIERTTAFKDLKDYKCQEMITTPLIEPFLGFTHLVGKPDWYKIVGDTTIIVDLKTAEHCEANKHHWDCISYSYYFKQAVYQEIIALNNPNITRFISRHLVVGKEKNVYPVKTFLLNQERIEKEKETLKQIIKKMASTNDWSVADTKWEDEEEIGAFN